MALAFTPDGSLLLVVDDDAILHIVHVESQSILFSQQLAEQKVAAVAMCLSAERWVVGMGSTIYTLSGIDLDALNTAIAEGDVAAALQVPYVLRSVL